jgi:hypothetical protein
MHFITLYFSYYSHIISNDKIISKKLLESNEFPRNIEMKFADIYRLFLKKFSLYKLIS